MSVDTFAAHSTGVSGPLSYAAEITPDDDADIATVSRALWIGTAGDLTVTMRQGQQVTFANLTVGWHPLRVSRVWATGTTASDIVACW